MKEVESVEGVLEEAGKGRFRIGDFVLKGGTVAELLLSDNWILGLVSFCGGDRCKFLVWEEGVEISLRPGLLVRALEPVYGGKNE